MSPEGLAKLRPAFKKDGVVTAGEREPDQRRRGGGRGNHGVRGPEEGIAPLGRVVAYATSGLEPKWVMMTPRTGRARRAAKAGWDLEGRGPVRAQRGLRRAQSCALLKVLGLPAEKVNVNGGAVALGHPIGASGTRCLLTLLYAMKDRGAKRGIVSLCLGGGNAVAMAIEAM